MIETALAACLCNTQDEWDDTRITYIVLATDFFRIGAGFTGANRVFLEKDASR